ncbi:recombinase family protein [Bacillus atrophaeus]|uniref:recombinase family protein n=1 Tax=Bacillus atrophaeus TaxID=1452 RepID=UPI00227F9F9E|nr:recombinase family protein [Bacillus atrophaeus]MCY8523135.1 recombinase family protein [Bacillus atrophaeus]MCY8526162.1 recombinase family protein [Bacillus atrophaeus]
MKYGYARVSSTGQDLTAQINALRDAGCEKIFKEKVSGRDKNKRPQFQKLLATVQEGDTIVVSKLDRFARSTKDALATIDQIKEKGVGLIVLNVSGEKLDTTTSTGKLMVTVLSAVAEFEADMIRERQIEGIELAKQRGVYKGRPHTYTVKHKGLQHALELYRDRDKNGLTVNAIAEITKISRATIYRAVREMVGEK